jgi:hypothetical protein
MEERTLMQLSRMPMMVLAALVALGVVTVDPAHAVTVNCLAAPFGGTITTAADADVVANNGTCTIGPTGAVDGSVKQTGIGGVVVQR